MTVPPALALLDDWPGTPPAWTAGTVVHNKPGERAVIAQLTPEEVVRGFFDCYTNGRPEDFD
jgi:hypothetical protein